MCLRRNTHVFDSSPPPKDGRLMPVLCDPGYSVFEFTDNQPCKRDRHESCPHHCRQKNYGLHIIAWNHNIGHVNCNTCTYFFPKQTVNMNLKSEKSEKKLKKHLKKLACNDLYLTERGLK